MQGLCFVALADDIGGDEIPNDTAVVLDEELSSESLQRLLDALMGACMCLLQHVLQDSRGRGNEDTALVDEEAVLNAPISAMCASRDRVPAVTELLR